MPSPTETPPTTRSSGGGDVKDTITFGAAGAPELFDPFYATDGETFRVTRQMMEGLVGIKPGTADIEPELATSWEASADGKEWTFTLREGVKFWDGEAFNAAAVCYNFERMFDQNEVAAGGPAGYWADVMGVVQVRRRQRALPGLLGQGRHDRGHQDQPRDVEVPDGPVAGLVLHAVAQGAQGW